MSCTGRGNPPRDTSRSPRDGRSRDAAFFPIDPAAFDRLESQFAKGGPAAAVEVLIAELRQAGDFNSLFYALLMKKRLELGVSPVPEPLSSADLPPHTHEPYEQAIREAGRRVGGLFLEKGELSKAWGFFRMLGEPDPVREALEKFAAAAGRRHLPENIEIAWQGGVLPKKGFDLILDRHGVCSAITTVSSSDLNAVTAAVAAGMLPAERPRQLPQAAGRAGAPAAPAGRARAPRSQASGQDRRESFTPGA